MIEAFSSFGSWKQKQIWRWLQRKFEKVLLLGSKFQEKGGSTHLFLNPIQCDFICIQVFASDEAYWTLKFLVLSKMTLK
jgi:hypothetical protein